MTTCLLWVTEKFIDGMERNSVWYCTHSCELNTEYRIMNLDYDWAPVVFITANRDIDAGFEVAVN